MRRCKHFRRITWMYKSHPDGTMEYGSSIDCEINKLIVTWGDIGKPQCNEGIYSCYTPVEIDPYWKDIVDETNRRLNNEK